MDELNKLTATASLEKLSDLELKNFINWHLCVTGYPALIELAEKIQLDRIGE